MTRKRDTPRVTSASISGQEAVGVLALPNVHNALDGPSAWLGERLHDAVGQGILWQSALWRWWQRQDFLQAFRRERRNARPLPPVFEQSTRRDGCTGSAADKPGASAVLPSATRRWLHTQQGLRRFVTLSGLGWGFVLAAVGWELFALAFCHCAGWGLDEGAFFLAWGLGILAFGFWLRPSRQRPATSRLFLGMNILVMSVLSLVVATK